MIQESLLRTILFTPGIGGRTGLPVMFWGLPGVGKSSMAESFVSQFGLPMHTIIASLREPADFLGLPIPDGHGGVNYAPPRWAIEAAEQENAVVFFDELPTAPPAVQNSLLRVILEGAVGDLKLPPGVRFIAAGNPVKITAGGHNLSVPLANRFGHIDIEEVDSSAWTQWLLAGGDTKSDAKPEDPMKSMAQAEAMWPSAFARARGLVAGYIHRHASALMKMPTANDPNATKAWASPRSWDMATHAHAGAEIWELNEIEQDELVSGFIGTAANAEFKAWVANADLPDPEDLLTGKTKWEHEEARPDRTLAVLNSCAAFCTSKKEDDLSTAYWGLLDGIASEHSDLVVSSARAMVKARQASSKPARQMLQKLRPVMVASGMIKES